MTETTAGQAQLFAALAKFQAELPKIAKDASAKIEPEGKKAYSYKYADLADVAEVVEPLIGKYGLAFTAKPTMLDGAFVLDYKLVHESGEFDQGIYPLPDPRTTKPQTVGSMITYARRYCLCAATGVAPNGDDDDAGTAQADFTSAGEAFANASTVRPGTRPAPAPPTDAQAAAGRPATTDTEWLADALEKAPVLPDGAQCRALWQESAEKVHAGTVTKEDAKRVQDILKERIQDIGREAKQKAAGSDSEADDGSRAAA